ncbi:MAG: transporter substrate-binding domain-containing protein [Atopobiaceae bacterium]|nr:transporter substrate-binding domain-containing protein [Atopobiaceae bacterium]
MKKLDELMLDRRQALGLGLGGVASTAAFALVGCGGGQAAPEASSTEASGSAAEASTSAAEASASEAEAKMVQIDASAFDSLVDNGPVADDASIEANEWAKKVKDAGKLRVGAVQTSQLFSLLNEVDNRVRGFDAGLYQLLTKYILGDASKHEVTLVQSSTRESVLQSDQVDAVFATYTINAERQKVISFAGPYFVGHQGILVMADNTDINSVDDLAGKVVGVQEGSNGRAVMEEFAPNAEVQELGTDEELRTALEQKRIDAYVVDATLHMGNMISNPGKYRMAAEFGPEDPLGIGLPLDSDGVDFVNEFLSKIEQDNIWADLWKVCIGERTGIDDVPEPPTIGA